MDTGKPKTLRYKRSHFVADLPEGFLYTPSHYWLSEQKTGLWRVGFTKFATRMLGELVDFAFEVEPGVTVETGQMIGWCEGFKAMTDLFCAGRGVFRGGNPELKAKLTLANKNPFGAGWLYEFEGEPDERRLEVVAYRDFLDKTIDRLLEKQKGTQIE
jgi:glycine cleavage system H protein